LRYALVLATFILVSGCFKREWVYSRTIADHEVSLVTNHKVIGNSVGMDNGVAYWSNHKHIIFIGETLVVDWMDYGSVKAEEPIRVELGCVFVSGKKRAGVSLTKKEIMQYEAGRKPFVFKVAHREIRVRPSTGSAYGHESKNDSTALTGDLAIRIKNGFLFVNGVSYGETKMGDVISIDFGEVNGAGVSPIF
jgi:hypothetical protein